MTKPRLIRWQAQLFRVVRQGWTNPLDTSFSRTRSDQRWNDGSFDALYCCGSERVARAVCFDILRFAGVVAADLQPAARPQLVEIAWTGKTVDVYTAAGVEAAGFGPDYPAGTAKTETRRAAAAWHGAAFEGVTCRSASLERMGQTAWPEDKQESSEVALWPANWTRQARLIRRRRDDRWLLTARRKASRI